MKKRFYTISLFVGASLCVTAQAVMINPYMDPNPPVKAGYNLIFADEFDTFNPVNWDKSTPGDDLWDYDEPNFCQKCKHTPMNASNVLEPPVDGILKLRVREGEDQNACDFSGAEIKTWNNEIWSNPNDPFQHWKVYPNSFVEVRLKVPECKGVGGAFWLYGGESGRFFEVDVFELYTDQSLTFQANIHYGKNYEDPSHQQHPREIMPIDFGLNNVNLADHFLTFGVAWDGTKIDMYLNNVKYTTYYFSGQGSANYNQYLYPVPFNIRLSTAASSLTEHDPSDCANLPTFMEIDYVRVFKKTSAKAISFLSGQNIALCADYFWGDGTNVKTNYYPGATYEWENSPNFNFTLNPNGLNGCNCMQWWTSVVPGTPPGVYPVKLKITFPGGYEEELTLNIRVMSGNPPTPSYISLVTDDYFFYYMQTPVANNTLGYEWSLDGGQTWNRSPNPATGSVNIWEKPFKVGPQPRTVNVCVRAYNACGTSAMICRTLTIPKICLSCLENMVPPRTVTVERIPENQDYYRLKVLQSPLSSGYEWALEEAQWSLVENSTDSDYNYFGQFAPGTPPFMVSVRAVSSASQSATYQQEITIPSDYILSMMDNPKPLPTAIEETISERATETPSTLDNASAEFTNFMLFNSLGQKMMAGDLDEWDETQLKEQLVPGVYFLVKQNIQGKQQKVSKIFVNR